MLHAIWTERRSVIRRAAAGQTNMAITMMDPTASKDATAATATMTMSAKPTSFEGIPMESAKPASNVEMASSFQRSP